MRFKAVLWDLDGTLADTAPDLSAALNHVLFTENQPPLSLDKIRPVCSDGTAGLLKLGFNIDKTDPQFAVLAEKFLAFYENHIADRTTLFTGIEIILDRLDAQQIPWGIVTNKPGHLTQKLGEKLKLLDRAHCIVAGDTVKNKKPHPEPLLHAANLLQIAPEHCGYIGDAERDITAANQARMFSIAALYGYISPLSPPTTWRAQHQVASVAELDLYLR